MTGNRSGKLSAERELGNRFRAERQRLNLSAGSVADHCQVSQSTVFNWETGKARVPLGAIAQFVNLGFDVQNMLTYPDKETAIALHLAEKGASVGESEDLLAKH